MPSRLSIPLFKFIGSKRLLLFGIVVLVFATLFLDLRGFRTAAVRAIRVQIRSSELQNNKEKKDHCNYSSSTYRQMVSKEDIFARLNYGLSPRGRCNCKREIKREELPDGLAESFCSDEATAIGEGQRVISFSIYSESEAEWNATKAKYFDGILPNARLMKELYPGWIMRVYSNLPYTPDICSVVCSDESIYFCDVHRLPQVGDISNLGMGPRSWRFLVLGDPTVKTFASRDLDSDLSQREKDAVDQWMESEYPIHAMRDHHFHDSHMQAGMWGADNENLCLSVASEIQRNIINWKTSGESDQDILGKVLYEPYRAKILMHDSFLCNEFHDSVPFPTRRLNDWDHVGSRARGAKHPFEKQCPVECRPSYGKDWEYC